MDSYWQRFGQLPAALTATVVAMRSAILQETGLLPCPQHSQSVQFGACHFGRNIYEIINILDLLSIDSQRPSLNSSQRAQVLQQAATALLEFTRRWNDSARFWMRDPELPMVAEAAARRVRERLLVIGRSARPDFAPHPQPPPVETIGGAKQPVESGVSLSDAPPSLARSRLIAMVQSSAIMESFLSPELGLHVFADRIGRMGESNKASLHRCGSSTWKLLNDKVRPWFEIVRDLADGGQESIQCAGNRCDIWDGIGEDDGIHFVFRDSAQGLVLWAFGWSGAQGGNAHPNKWNAKFGRFLTSAAAKPCSGKK